ncbi:MAG: hypothetical protein ACRENL_11950 [Candidatus Dormibacteria bacterium]
MTLARGLAAWLVLLSGGVLAACGPDTTVPTDIPGVVRTAGATAAGSTPTAGGDAAQAVQAFLNDLHAGNCPAAYALTVDPLRTRSGSSGGLCAAVPMSGTYSVGATTALTASSAFVTVTVTNPTQTATDTITVLYQAPSWMVSDVVAQGGTTPGPGEVSIAHLVSIIEEQYQAQNNATVTVTCPQAATIESTPGQKFGCTFSDAHGRSGSLTVTINSTHGAFTWSIP